MVGKNTRSESGSAIVSGAVMNAANSQLKRSFSFCCSENESSSMMTGCENRKSAAITASMIRVHAKKASQEGAIFRSRK